MVLVYILEHTDLDKKIFTRSNGQIQRDLGLSQPTVTRAMQKIEELGAITKLPIAGWKVNLPLKKPSVDDDLEDNVLVANYGR